MRNALYDVGVYLGNVREELRGTDGEDLRVFSETDESNSDILSSVILFRGKWGRVPTSLRRRLRSQIPKCCSKPCR